MKPYDLGLRVFRAARFGARQLTQWRVSSQTMGIRPAFFDLVRTNLGIASLDDASWGEQQSLLQSLRAQVSHQRDQLHTLREALAEQRTAAIEQTHVIESRFDETTQRHSQQLQAVTDQQHQSSALLQTAIDALRGELAQLQGAAHSAAKAHEQVRDHLALRLDLQETLIRDLERLTRYEAWVASAQVPADVKVSVILATRNRSALLPRAVASVRSQTLPNFELLIVDDASTDATPEIAATLAATDSRIRVIQGEGRGVSAARNRGLAAATGSIIAYLDDDNVMLPMWLKAVVWAFDQRPDTDVLYGARLMEKATLDGPVQPTLHFEAFDRAGLENHNFIDMGVLAHRAGLKEAVFNETLEAAVDWDLALRLTRDKPAYPLPVLALAYYLGAPSRISTRPSPHLAVDHVRQMHRRLRVLAYNAIFPLLTETYISDEAQALVKNGAHLDYCRHSFSVVAPARVPERVFTDLKTAVEVTNPDVLLLHWVNHAEDSLERLETIGRPFALRIHSFDFDVTRALRIKNHPLCIGVWAYPHHAAQIPGAHAMPSLFTSHSMLPELQATRDLVLSVSAGLPKKNFDFLIDVMAGLTGVERRIVIGMTNGHEDLPQKVVAKLKSVSNAPLLQVNLERSDVFALLARTSVMVYTLDGAYPFGMPMSVIEAMTAGAAVVVPDRPEARALTGPGFRGYTTAAELTAQINDVLAGGPRIEAERLSNRAYALERFCNPVNEDRFSEEITAALEAWHARSQAIAQASSGSVEHAAVVKR